MIAAKGGYPGTRSIGTKCDLGNQDVTNYGACSIHTDL